MKVLAVLLLPLVTLFGSQQYKANPYREARVIRALGEGASAPPPFASVNAAVNNGVVPVASESPQEPREINPVPSVWHELAVCESGWYGEPRWDYNGPSGFDGGVQFHPNTWSSYKHDGYPDYAYQATPEQQIEIGRLVAAEQGAGAWPSCTAKLGISTKDLLQ